MQLILGCWVRCLFIISGSQLTTRHYPQAVYSGVVLSTVNGRFKCSELRGDV